MYKKDFILWGYALLRKNVYDDDYNLIECFEEISKTLNKKNIVKIIFDEIKFLNANKNFKYYQKNT